MANHNLRSFHNAVFLPNGELIGVATLEVGKLSEKWLGICASFLAHHGDVFRASWGQQLSHVETRLTAAEGAAIGTFYARGELVVSTLYLSGEKPGAEGEVTELFIDSLGQTEAARTATGSPSPFDTIRDLGQRPLVTTIVLGNPEVSDQDNNLVKELSTHFAAALFLRFQGSLPESG